MERKRPDINTFVLQQVVSDNDNWYFSQQLLCDSLSPDPLLEGCEREGQIGIEIPGKQLAVDHGPVGQ